MVRTGRFVLACAVLVVGALLVAGPAAAARPAAVAAVQSDDEEDDPGINEPGDSDGDDGDDEGDGDDGGGGDRRPVEMAVMGGTVVDAETEDPLAGAEVFLLAEGVARADWDEEDDGVYTRTRSDRAGEFLFSDPIERGGEYALCAGAAGYDVACSGLAVRATADDGDVVLWTLALRADGEDGG